MSAKKSLPRLFVYSIVFSFAHGQLHRLGIQIAASSSKQRYDDRLIADELNVNSLVHAPEETLRSKLLSRFRVCKCRCDREKDRGCGGSIVNHGTICGISKAETRRTLFVCTSVTCFPTLSIGIGPSQSTVIVVSVS